MKRLTSNIVIGDYTYKGVVSCNISSNTETLTDTAELTFPMKTDWKTEKKSLKDLIKRGDEITVNIGYDGNNIEVFTGYVRAIKADIPFTVSCEDGMFKLKKNPVSKSFNKTDLNEVLTTIIPSDIKFVTDGRDLGKFRINNATPVEVLKYLKEKYGVYSYFKKGILYCGLQYQTEGKQNHEFVFSKDIIDYSNLEYKIAEDVKIKVKAISINDDNNKEEEKAGDADGELRTFHYYNVDKATLKQRAEEELLKFKYDGYSGSFVTFGDKQVNHGDTVKLTDKKYPEREGTYIVKSVNTEFGTGGYRQTIELDRLWS